MVEHISVEQWRRLKTRRPRKYRNVPTVVDGVRFDSKREAAHWGKLRLLEQQGVIRELERQVKFPLVVNGALVATYVADMVYVDAATQQRVVVDVKSPATRTAVYRLKQKLLRALHGIEISEA